MNAFDQEMTCRIALELNLKKAIVGVSTGSTKWVESSATRRRRHAFTRIHDARGLSVYGDQQTIGALIRDLHLAAADAYGSRQIETDQGTIDLDGESGGGSRSIRP